MKNWAGNYTYVARRLLEPSSPDELRAALRDAAVVRVIGTRHSFNDIGDTHGDLVSLARMPRVIEIDNRARTVLVDGALRYGDLCGPLNDAGFALHNMASLPHISIAGAVATGTHGSGAKSASMSTAVAALELMTADGELVNLRRGDADFDGAVVSLGGLGVVVRLWLDIEPAYSVRQVVYENLPLDLFAVNFETLTEMGESVSAFTWWRGDRLDQLWVKQRVPAGVDVPDLPDELFGAVRATVNRHPIDGLPADATTPQLGIPGPWHERVPHFRMDHTPSSGAELHSEYFVAYEDAVPAFLALQPLRERIGALVQVTEIRTIAADSLWLSPCHERASAAFHFTWKPKWPPVRALLPEIEAALAPFRPRPHWAKLHTMPRATIAERYPRLADFAALARRYDPTGKFRNDYLARLIDE